MLLIKGGRGKHGVCYPHAGTGEQAASTLWPMEVLLDCFKSTLQRQSNERHVFLHQGELLLGIFYLQFSKEAKPPHF